MQATPSKAFLNAAPSTFIMGEDAIGYFSFIHEWPLTKASHDQMSVRRQFESGRLASNGDPTVDM